MPPIPRKGSKATANITMPAPPMAVAIDRHNKIAFGCASMSVKIVAPVVDNPDTASNKAS